MVKSKPIIDAVVAIILNNTDQVLISKRRSTQSYAGYWEFPGGKIEKNELPGSAIVRELKEELDIEVIDYKHLDKITYNYPEFIVNLNVFLVNNFNGIAIGNEGQEIKWLPKSEINSHPDLLPASYELLKLINL